MFFLQEAPRAGQSVVIRRAREVLTGVSTVKAPNGSPQGCPVSPTDTPHRADLAAPADAAARGRRGVHRRPPLSRTPEAGGKLRAVRAKTKRLIRRAALAAGGLALAAASLAVALWLTLPDPAPLARQYPRTTAIVEQRRAEARASRRPFRARQVWVGPEGIAPVVVHALVLSEDANFFGHDGLDWEAIREAAEHDLKVGRYARGASTLTQQLAKNLWLGTEKSLWRKAKEAVLAAKLERTLTKRRILALYLNVVELDDGVFGIEAGARARFGTSAAALTPAQAVVLVSLLPAPRRVDLARPSTWLENRSRRLLDRLHDTGRLSAQAHLRASAELDRILAGPAPADDRDEPPEEEEHAPAAADRAPSVASAAPAAAAAPPGEGGDGARAAGDAAPVPALPAGSEPTGSPAAAPQGNGDTGSSVSGTQAPSPPMLQGQSAAGQE
jgi:monofunctional biosynthetic peptidoglycan transglycosylase